jgi:hypothetical protein
MFRPVQSEIAEALSDSTPTNSTIRPLRASSAVSFSNASSTASSSAARASVTAAASSSETLIAPPPRLA